MEKSLKAYLKIETLLFFREPLQVVFSFLFPAAMFSIFASVFSGEGAKEYFEAYIPGYFSSIIYIVSMFLIGYPMVADKENGVYNRLKATPFPLGLIYKAMVIKALILCIIGGAEILLLAKFAFGASLTNHWLQVLFGFIVGNVSAVAAGFAIFSLCKTAKQALTVILISFYPCVMLADNTFPLSMMPEVLRKMAPIINPLYHLNRILCGAWTGRLMEEAVSILYVSVTIVILCFISYRYERSAEHF